MDPYYPQFMSRKRFLLNLPKVFMGFLRILKYLRFTTKMYFSRQFRHEPTVLSKISKKFDQLWCIAQFYHIYRKLFSDKVLLDAHYVTHSVPREIIPTQEICFSYTKKLLKEYASAQLVITSRIHCALPCLALQTPVIFINSTSIDEIRSSGRFEGLLNLFHVMDLEADSLNPDSYLATKFSPNNRRNTIPLVKNKSDYIEIRRGLIKTCRQFMSNDGSVKAKC